MATATKDFRASRQVPRHAGVVFGSAANTFPVFAGNGDSCCRPVDFAARRSAAIAQDDFDAERWVDEGGSFSSEGVTQ
jgi:hypothetical protein